MRRAPGTNTGLFTNGRDKVQAVSSSDVPIPPTFTLVVPDLLPSDEPLQVLKRLQGAVSENGLQSTLSGGSDRNRGNFPSPSRYAPEIAAGQVDVLPD